MNMSQKYHVTIGLEIHAELNTKTKMFSNAPNDPFSAEPNTNINPVDMAHPGTLPTINMEAVRKTIMVGLALGGDIANFTEFDRKNYFYPDIPKGYQISQYKYPIVSGGKLGGIDVTRVHLEEDTATSKHSANGTLVDYNRAGVPLMELVTEPVMHSPEQAGHFARELQILLRYLGVSEANMERGEMRVELNISLSADPDTLGTKVEVKNIASFNMMERAAKYETARMTKLLDEGRGDEIVQETRGWNDVKQITVSQRSKENANDYRYFPDPDLPKLHLHEIFNLDEMKSELPELPSEKRVRYTDMYGIKSEDIEAYLLDQDLATFFENVATILDGNKDMIKKASNYLTSDLVALREIAEHGVFDKMEPRDFATLMQMIDGGDVNSRGAKDILAELVHNGGDPKSIADERGLIQKSDPEEVKKFAQEVIDENPGPVEQYRGGNENTIKFMMGQVMKKSGGSANPKIAEEVLKEMLK
ncbi:MAG: Asp-tRNA(Asn)/Glu-tRNA(Gln) amidotransferase subunit GatB [Candidatus Nomurabacteria bacterium]|nr:Asp-tRNA(Asn)/Glu-tRNA(Gln) amidotransferase subunit GatB [Candidatus Nomurabacteria bacterium]